MAGQGQVELNVALYDACGRDNDQARAEELLGRGADPTNALYGSYNALHMAACYGREQIVAILLSKCAVLEASEKAPRSARW
jgi:hypothetical protein